MPQSTKTTGPAGTAHPPSEDPPSTGEADTRTRLLAAAGPVFAAHGFDGATVREICAAADVNIASVGYYFGDKLGLYRQVIQGIRDARERRFPTPDNITQDARQTLLKIVQTLLSRMLEADPSGWETQLMMREMHHPTPVFDSIVGEFFRPLFDRLVHTIELLMDPSAPRHTLEQLALSVVGQCLYYRVGSGVVQILIPEPERQQHYNIDTLSRHITAVTLAAIDDGAVLHKRAEIERWPLDNRSETPTS